MAAHKTVFNDKQRILRLYSALISHRALSIEEIEDMFLLAEKLSNAISRNPNFLHDLQIGEPIKSEIF